MTSISAAIICAKDEPFIHLTLQSLPGCVDEVVLVGDPSRETRKLIKEGTKAVDYDFTLYWRDWDFQYGKARQYALDKCKSEYCLQIDADEILSDTGFKLKKIAESKKSSVYHLKYEHFIWNFGLLDNTFNPHVGINRFFEREGVTYSRDLHELPFHPLWEKEKHLTPLIEDPILWHLGYVTSRSKIRDKYLMNLEKSPIHSKEYLHDWFSKHMFGKYPVRPVTPQDFQNFPTALKKYLFLNNR